MSSGKLFVVGATDVISCAGCVGLGVLKRRHCSYVCPVESGKQLSDVCLIIMEFKFNNRIFLGSMRP